MGKTLCEFFGHQKLHRKYLEDTSTGKCPKCKNKKYDLKILGSTKCPHCGTELIHPKRIMIMVCDACNLGNQSILDKRIYV